MSTSIVVERTYPHAREKVWRALTDAELLGRWLMPNDFEPSVGHRFRFETEPAPGFDGIVHCEVLRVEEPETLSFTWKGGPIDTVVTFTLSDVPGSPVGTRLRMEQSGFEGFKAWLVGRFLKSGCKKIYGRLLPDLLERMDDFGAVAPGHANTCKTPLQRMAGAIVGLFTRTKERR